MKKFLLVLISLCLAFTLSCASTESGSSDSGEPRAAAARAETGNLGAFNLRLEDDFEWGTSYNVNLHNRNLLSGHRIQPGETYTLKVTYTTSRDLEDKLQLIFVDRTERGNWWTELTINDENTQIPASTAGQVMSATLTFKTIAAASSSTAEANGLTIMTDGEGTPRTRGGGAKGPVTLSFTEFVLTRVE